jgi:septal ring factor EnvC (AmiA/AmiB activator)
VSPLAPEDFSDALARIEQKIEVLTARTDERRGQYLEKIDEAKRNGAAQGVRILELEKGLARNDEATARIGLDTRALEARIEEMNRKLESMRETLIRTSVISSLCSGGLAAGITAAVMRVMGG